MKLSTTLRRYDRAKPAVPSRVRVAADDFSENVDLIYDPDMDFSENVDLIYDPDMDSDHCSDSIKLFDLRSPLLDLGVTVYPDGGSRPVGVCRSTTSVV